MSQIQEKNTLFLKVLLLITTAILFLAMLFYTPRFSAGHKTYM